MTLHELTSAIVGVITMSLCINPNCPSPENVDTQLFCQGCGSELLLEARYRVVRLLGSGGFGKTYEVSDRDSTLKVLKILTHNHPKYVELFQREAGVLSQLHHPSIPKVEPDSYFTFSPANSQQLVHCLVMEKVEGLNLSEYLQKRRYPIDQKLAIQWLTQLVEILRVVHSQNFFHRDIKPSNIMLKTDGHLVLIDFGTARAVSETYVAKQALGNVTGVVSPGYTPIEQMNGQAVLQSDFFALGRTFVYLLTGKDPREFYDPHTHELRWRHAALGSSFQFADLLDSLMARLPSQRPANADLILQQIAEIKKDLQISQASFIKAQSESSFGTVPTQSSVQPNTPTVPYTPPQTQSRIESGFLNRCKKELAEFIGPIASIVCQRTLIRSPELSETEFVEALAQQIPNQKQALEFKRRLL